MSALAHLSLQYVTGHRVPHVPTPEERLAAFRRFQPVQFANTQFPHASAVRHPLQGGAGSYFDPPAWDEVPVAYADRRGF